MKTRYVEHTKEIVNPYNKDEFKKIFCVMDMINGVECTPFSKNRLLINAIKDSLERHGDSFVNQDIELKNDRYIIVSCVPNGLCQFTFAELTQYFILDKQTCQYVFQTGFYSEMQAKRIAFVMNMDAF